MQFREFLEMQRYARSVIIQSGNLCRHFFVWLHLSDIPLVAADERVRRRFLAHDCACVHPGFLDRPVGFAGSAKSGLLLRRLAAFLADRNVIPAPKVPKRHAERWEHLDAFLHWLRQHRGLRDSSIEQYERRLRTLLPALGGEPGTYDVARVRNTVLGRLETASRDQVGREAIALRMYLRFLGTNGLCRPELVHAVPTVPRLWSGSLPRHVGQNDIERMIATCDVTMPIGLRDRAALLLLARLALRAGDVSGLALDDIDWDRAVILGRRQVAAGGRAAAAARRGRCAAGLHPEGPATQRREEGVSALQSAVPSPGVQQHRHLDRRSRDHAGRHPRRRPGIVAPVQALGGDESPARRHPA